MDRLTPFLRVVALTTSIASVAAASAADQWTNIRPGIDYLFRTTSGPRRIHAAVIDLSRPEIWIRASREDERRRTVGSYASLVGAVVAINGDWFDYSTYRPLGLAIGHGRAWSTNQDDRGDWGFLACNATKECWMDGWGTTAPFTPRYWNVVGGSQDRLVIDGVAQHYGPSYYSVDRHPRSAVGLSADGKTMYLVTVDGRSSSSIGMTFNEMADLLVNLGAHQGMMLDGGGSSTLVIDGQVRNTPSDGSQRVVANHLGIMVSPTTDAGCIGQENGKHCLDATWLATCTGGRYSEGNCGAFGLSCEESGAFAYCVDPRCQAGGQGRYCREDRYIASCTDGIFSEGDCGYYGTACVTGFGDAWCALDFWQATLEDVSFPLTGEGVIEVEEGETVHGTVRFVNTGRSPWTPGVTKLTPLPRGDSSPVADASWLGPTRISTVASTVEPGASGTFALALHGGAVGEHSLSLGLVEEAVTWFGDKPLGGGPADGELRLTVRVVPASADPTDGGPDDPVSDAGSGTPDGGSSAGPDGGGPTRDGGGMEAPDAGGSAGSDGGTSNGSGGAGPGGGSLLGGCGCGADATGGSLSGLLLLAFAMLAGQRRSRAKVASESEPRRTPR